MTIFERIESLRKSKGISQGKLEKELGFSNGSISKWKTSTPTTERLQKLADYFGVTVGYLMTGIEPDYMFKLNNDEYLIIETYRDLPDSSRLRLMKYAKMLHSLHELEKPVLNAAHENNPTVEQKFATDELMENDKEWE